MGKSEEHCDTQKVEMATTGVENSKRERRGLWEGRVQRGERRRDEKGEKGRGGESRQCIFFLGIKLEFFLPLFFVFYSCHDVYSMKIKKRNKSRWTSKSAPRQAVPLV